MELRSASGLLNVVFQVPEGRIRLSLPDELASGDNISGTVFLEPAGSASASKDTSIRELAGYAIELEGHIGRPAGKHFQWRLPVASSASVLLRDRNKKVLAVGRIPVEAMPEPPEPVRRVDQYDLPLGGQAGSIISVQGPFRGDLGETAVTIGGSPAMLIAESPRKVVFQIPGGVVGRSTIEVIEREVVVKGTFQSLGLQATSTTLGSIRGETAVMTAVVSGLQGLREPVYLTVFNRSPEVLTMEGGRMQHIAIQPAESSPGGTFRLTRTLTRVQPGPLDIFVLATRAPTSEIQLERITQRAVDGWSRANEISVSGEARMLIASSVAAARLQLDDFLIAQRVLRADPASLLDSLVRVYCFDLRDRKLRARGRLARGRGIRPGFAASFAPPAAKAGLEAGDVRTFSFLQYLAGLLSQLTPSQPVAYLAVTSKPDSQFITIDNRGGADYFTNRKFIVSVGEHTVKVASCQQVLRAIAYQTIAVRCGS